MSVLNKTISYFPSVTATMQGVNVNLLTLLQSNNHKEKIIKLRQSDGVTQKQLKEKLPCFTVSGIFSRRCEEGIIQLSGLAAVDLDSAEDYDVIHLLNELKKIDSIAYAGLSCRGKRLFCIVPFKNPDLYVKHYQRLIKSFIDLGLPMGDDCHKIISQPRFVSWNDKNTHFFNHNAKPYHLLPVEKTYFTIKHNNNENKNTLIPDNPFNWCVEQINKSHSFCKGARHDYIIHLARYCNMKGITESETIQGCSSFIETDFPETEIKKIVENIYTSQSGSHAKIPFEVRQKTFQPSQLKIDEAKTIAINGKDNEKINESKELEQFVKLTSKDVLKPNNNPFRPTNINNTDQVILEHFLSYIMPYNVEIESELNSLVSGFEHETNIKVEPNKYREIILKYALSKN